MSILRHLTGTKNSLLDGQLSKKMLVSKVLEDMDNEGKIKKHSEYMMLPSKLKLAKKLAKLELLYGNFLLTHTVVKSVLLGI